MSQPQLITADLLKTMPLPVWNGDTSKTDFGKLLVIAGSARLPGAAILAAKAALRSGCGTVRVAVPRSVATAIGAAVPELMVLPLPETQAGTLAASALPILAEQFEPCDAAVIGPGLDEHDETDELARRLMAQCPLPLVVDAHALVALSRASDAGWGTAAGPRLLTPNHEEMEMLLGAGLEEIGVSREAVALNFAAREQAVLVLKGSETLIAAPDGSLFKNTAGTRGLGTAGSGDVLAGVLGALLAQGLESVRAAVWGVYLHARAGEAAGHELGDDGMMASDVLERLPVTLRELRHET